MNEQHTKSFRAAYDYWFEDKPLNEAIELLAEKKKSEDKEDKKEKGESKAKEKKEEHEASETKEEEKVEEKAKKADKKKKKDKKDLKENAFETHVLCNKCNSGNLELSKKKTKIRCKECGNTGLTEGIIGLSI
jgi:ribosomal protein S27E